PSPSGEPGGDPAGGPPDGVSAHQRGFRRSSQSGGRGFRTAPRHPRTGGGPYAAGVRSVHTSGRRAHRGGVDSRSRGGALMDSGYSYSIAESAQIPAPAHVVYQLLADYRNGHPRIV